MKIKLLIMVVLIFLTTGCASYTELNNLSIVNTLGIDYKDGKYYLTMNVIEGNLDDSTIEKELTTYKSSNSSLNEAFNDIYINSNKRLYLSHIDLLILTEDAINNNFKQILNNFLENNEYRNNFNVILIKDISLEEFMNLKIEAEEINQLLKTNEQETAMTKVKDLETIMKELLIDGNTYLPTISHKDNDIVLKGYTLLKNYKVFEELTLDESIILNLLSNKVHKSYLNGSNIFDNQTILTTKKNKINFKFLITISSNNKFENKTKQDIEKFLIKYQEKDYDILKLVEEVRKNDYSYYKKTNTLLSKLSFDITFEIKIKENYIQGDYLDEKR